MRFLDALLLLIDFVFFIDVFILLLARKVLLMMRKRFGLFGLCELNKCEDILPVVFFCFGFAQFLIWDRLSFLNSVGGDFLVAVLASKFLFRSSSRSLVVSCSSAMMQIILARLKGTFFFVWTGWQDVKKRYWNMSVS